MDKDKVKDKKSFRCTLNLDSKSFFKGILFSCIFLSLFGIIFAIGFHTASEVTSGTFVGDYVFTGNVDLTGASVSGGTSSSTPSGAVMAFNLASCPVGWKACDGTDGTPDLRGQFIRGLNSFDGGLTNRSDGYEDPDSRILMSYQNDSFQGHWHMLGDTSGNEINVVRSTNTGSGYKTSNPTTTSGINVQRAVRPVTDNSNGVPRYDVETRPKNIALIYCQKE